MNPDTYVMIVCKHNMKDIVPNVTQGTTNNTIGRAYTKFGIHLSYRVLAVYGRSSASQMFVTNSI